MDIIDYITVQGASKKWGLSDRRIRILCSESRIPGVIKKGKSYQIPSNAQKPEDGRFKTPNKDFKFFLKWNNDVIGLIDDKFSVTFTKPNYNETISLYTKGNRFWTTDKFTKFLSQRLVSSTRRDIERILFRLGLIQYDVITIAKITRAIHPKDLIWIAYHENEEFDKTVTTVFQSIFHQHVDIVGDSIDTPEGYNIKRYGVFNGKYGIYKKRISPIVTDLESEIAVYLLAKKLGVKCCPAYRVDKDTMFSEFLYCFSKEYIIHFRRLFDGKRGNNEYQNLISVRPQYKDEIAKMILLDFITRQDDRHLSNIAIKITDDDEMFYPLYDNGRSLFYEDTKEMVEEATSDLKAYSTSFGFLRNYWDYVLEIKEDRETLADLLDLNITDDDIKLILKEAGFTSYRFDGALKWISQAITMIKDLK